MGGDGVGRGYLRRPALTAGRFVPHPLSTTPGARLYRTGDRVRWGEDGTIEFLGRIDTQVKVRGFRIEPAEIEAVLAEHPAVGEAVVALREDVPGEKRLVGYVVPARAGDGVPEAAALRAHLAGRLPEHMVPGAFVVLDALPLSPHGKLDRRRLPPPAQGADAGEAYEAPRTAIEETLARVWAEVLRAERVGVHDDYFALGGDSILSIQVVSRARRAGLQLRPRDLFQHPTVARLAAVATPIEASGTPRPTAAAAAGEVPLTPIQHWFLAREVPGRDHWNMSLLLEARRAVDPAHVEAALRAVAAHHDAFRLRFTRGADGGWMQAYAPGDPAIAFERADLSGIDPAPRGAEMERRCEAAQASLDLARGPLLRALWIDLGDGRPRLLLAAHHLVMDGVSWRVLLDDLQAAHDRVARGEPVRLPERTTAWGTWAARLAAHARAGGFDGERAYWTAAARRKAAPLPVDFPGGENTAARARDVRISLSTEETRALLQEVPPVYRTQVDDALLAALARAWKAWTGEDRLRVELEGHGREERFPELDLSRTAGWFTSLYPVLLDVAGAEGPGGALKAVKEQLRAVPGRGIGYGALRWLGADDARAALAAFPAAEVRFEYLGQLDGAVADDAPFALAAESPGAAMHPGAPRTHALVVTGGVLGGRLQLTLGYSDGLHREETVRRLADALAAELRALVAHCREAGAGGYTPSDFPLAGLDQETLDRVVGNAPGIDDVYPLTPMQEGMLFHTLLEPESGMYLAQMGFDLAGEVDADRLVRAWQGAVDRHESLRAAYVVHGVPRALQVIRRRVPVPVHREDWRGLAAAEQDARRRAWLADDRARGFDVGRAPLMRVALFRMRDDLHHVVWSFHQTLLDGWSVALVYRDVRALYRAAIGGTAAALPAPVGFRGYAGWLAARDAGAAEAWWREALRGFAAPTPLGIGPGGETGHAIRAETLGEDETAALAAFARRHGLTLNTLLQGAWALLLSRYAGEEDVVFGTTVSGRPPELAGVEEMVGLFINTVPVRAHADPAARVAPWLKALQAGAAAGREHGHAPLAQVQQWSEVPAGTPLFESLLVFENYPADEGAEDGDGWAAEVTEIVNWTHYALTLTAVPGPRLSLRLKHDRARFGDAAAARLLGHLRALLAGMAAHPGAPLAALELLSGAERAALAAEWDAAAAPFTDGVPLHALFEAWAARTPDAPALDFDGRVLSYAELDVEANRLAHALRRRGVWPETRVAVFLEPGVEMIVALLAVLKAGGAYVPLDPASPPDRVGYMLGDARAALVLSAAGVAGRLPAGAPPVLLLDGGVTAGEPEHAPAGGAGAGSLVYAIYTSGSTGRPKGVLVEHRGVVNSVEAFRRIYRIGPGARVLLFAPLHFDASVLDIFTALCGGATLVVARRDDMLPGDPLVALLERARVTHAKFTPSALAATPWAPLPALRTVISGGEALSAEVVARWAPGRRFLNGYGPTEASVRVTAVECEDGTRTPPIGRAVDNARLYVLDAGLRPLPQEVLGELCIGGPGVARGYHGRPALTAEKFVPDPFSPVPGARMYRTGDRVRRRGDGLIDFVGRVDFQAKIRGYRIEPAEVETALRACPGVTDAVVVASEDATADARLVTYVVAPGAAPAALRAHLRGRLPEYMVPAAFVLLPALPLTAQGKVDRRALPAPDAADLEQGAFVAPRTPAEEVLAGIWSEVLGVGRVGAHDDFFALGGHSLRIMRVVGAVRDAFGVTLPLRALFDDPTLAALAARIAAAAESAAGGDAAPPLVPVPRDAPLPLSFAQARLWFLQALEPGSSTYNMPFPLRLRGPLDVDALSRALTALAARHEVLRTRFERRAGGPVQVAEPPAPTELARVDLSGLAPAAREARLRALARGEAARPFDLSRAPLFRATLVRMAGDDHALLFTLHHVAGDGWSLEVMAREVSALYAAFAAGAAPDLAPLPVQYADYAAWQRGWIRGEVLERQLGWWREALAGAPPALALPTDFPHPEHPRDRGETVSRDLPPGAGEALEAVARRESATAYMAFMAVLAVHLFRATGEEDLVIGAPTANRTRPEVQGLIGFFVNLLPLRLRLGGNPTFRAVLRQVRGTALAAYTHAEVPFETLVQELDVERVPGRRTLVQVALTTEAFAQAPPAFAGVSVALEDFAEQRTKFDLELSVGTGDDGARRASLLYDAALFRADTARALLDDFVALLAQAAEAPDRRILDFVLEGEDGPVEALAGAGPDDHDFAF
ncbi:MAG TPA: amino acid adenylation domain-containing protein [Longimicrobium sp.]|nr:amino acid adenylation domain-containing protein [Longimicrobium sp.]